jgi:antirestriction protein
MSKIYVGTYSKYNNGSLHGAWLDLEDFSGKEEFLQACEELHSDEDQPELMFQDWEDIPASFITESSIDERTWDWLDLDADARQAVASYLEQVDHCSDIAAALECHEGVHESEQDWARDFWDQTGMASELPEYAQNYIDYEQFARDARLGGDMVFVNEGRKVRAFRRF